MFGGVWLLFLIFPITALVSSEAPSPWQAVGVTATALFVLLYLFSHLIPKPGRLSLYGGAAAWTAALGALGLLTVPAIGAQALAFMPYLVAISVFRLPAPWDAVGAIVPTTAVLALLVAFSEPQYLVWLLFIALIPLILLVPIRRVANSLERRSALDHELAMSRQREQVGRDVHDILGHSLTVIAVKTELASKLLHRDPGRARIELEDVLELTRSSLNEVRATVTQLQAPQLASQLVAAETALEAAGIRGERATRIPNVNDSDSHLLAWCLREAITNVMRHSEASRCSITISETGLTVTDDGVGQVEAAEGHGLRGMRQRITDAGGTMVLSEADPGAPRPGTHLEVAL